MDKNTEIEHAMELFRQVMFPLWHISRSGMQKLVTREYGITSSQFHTMRRIKHGDDSVSILANCMHVSRPNISRTVDELVEDDLVNRNRDPEDRRNVQLSLTKKGEELFQTLHEKHDSMLAEQFSILSDEELKRLSDALKILEKVVNYSIKKE